MNWTNWEKQTVFCMIRLWCRHQKHTTLQTKIGAKTITGLCPDCFALYEYTGKKLSDCRYGLEKPVCSSCITHCYQSVRREEIRQVMRYSGPRMMLHHPLRALIYMVRKKGFISKA